MVFLLFLSGLTFLHFLSLYLCLSFLLWEQFSLIIFLSVFLLSRSNCHLCFFLKLLFSFLSVPFLCLFLHCGDSHPLFFFLPLFPSNFVVMVLCLSFWGLTFLSFASFSCVLPNWGNSFHCLPFFFSSFCSFFAIHGTVSFFLRFIFFLSSMYNFSIVGTFPFSLF